MFYACLSSCSHHSTCRVTRTLDEPWLFWLREKPEDPQIEPHAGIKMAQVLVSLYICGLHIVSMIKILSWAKHILRRYSNHHLKMSFSSVWWHEWTVWICWEWMALCTERDVNHYYYMHEKLIFLLLVLLCISSQSNILNDVEICTPIHRFVFLRKFSQEKKIKLQASFKHYSLSVVKFQWHLLV